MSDKPLDAVPRPDRMYARLRGVVLSSPAGQATTTFRVPFRVRRAPALVSVTEAARVMPGSDATADAPAGPAGRATLARPITFHALEYRASSATHAARAVLVSTLVLAGIFVVNLVQTYADTQWLAWTPEYGFGMANAMLSLERWAGEMLGRSIGSYLSFDYHDQSNAAVLWAYTAAYFAVFPLLGAAVAIALARRGDPSSYRVLVYAVAIDYAISVLFFIGLPVPERWAFPDSGAVLLSDLLPNGWGYWLIERIRPVSALDNSFPSFHVSMTVVVILAAYVYRIRFRAVVAVLGAAVILSTYFLGVHWLPDLVAGTAVATISFCLAERFYARTARTDVRI